MNCPAQKRKEKCKLLGEIAGRKNGEPLKLFIGFYEQRTEKQHPSSMAAERKV